MIVTLTLNAAVDKAYHIRGTVCPGTVMRGRGDTVRPGRREDGALLEQLTYQDGLNGRFVHVDAEIRCCINILDENHQSTELLEPGEAVTPVEMERFLGEFKNICGDAEVVTMSGSVPKGVRRDIYKELVKEVKSWGKTVILDTSGELLAAGIEAAPDMIKPNQEELAMLLKRPVDNLEDIKTAALELHRAGIGQVAVSLGKDGALLVCRDGIFHGLPPRIKAMNTVGCGDSMVAAFAVAYKRGFTSRDSLKYAVAISACNALSDHTGYFETEKLERIYPCVRVQELTI